MNTPDTPSHAQRVRNTLRSSQAMNSNNPVRTVYEIGLEVYWRVAEIFANEKLPR